MPILEYACESCGNHFDKLIRGMNVSNPDVACPSCGGNEVEKQVSTFGVTGVWQSNVPEFTIPKAKAPDPNDPFNCIM
ncbi:MAG: zinc ribbon domain-containing protein [Chloroflexota bacterium]|jgi:putative FmdB family regulatory protein|nr:zinc ribbon domain-containing protein [Chloroflexota bacterium]|tara:strand:- start:222 stop:455 length:234 start_codon:yes stop_codon:yes gene_type:complete